METPSSRTLLMTQCFGATPAEVRRKSTSSAEPISNGMCSMRMASPVRALKIAHFGLPKIDSMWPASPGVFSWWQQGKGKDNGVQTRSRASFRSLQRDGQFLDVVEIGL